MRLPNWPTWRPVEVIGAGHELPQGRFEQLRHHTSNHDTIGDSLEVRDKAVLLGCWSRRDARRGKRGDEDASGESPRTAHR